MGCGDPDPGGEGQSFLQDLRALEGTGGLRAPLPLPTETPWGWAGYAPDSPSELGAGEV